MYRTTKPADIRKNVAAGFYVVFLCRVLSLFWVEFVVSAFRFGLLVGFCFGLFPTKINAEIKSP